LTKIEKIEIECDDAIGHYQSSIRAKNQDFELTETSLKRMNTILEESEISEDVRSNIKIKLSFEIEKMKVYRSIENIRFTMVIMTLMIFSLINLYHFALKMVC